VKRALPETSCGTAGDATYGLPDLAKRTASNDSDDARTGAETSAMIHLSSAAFKAWLADYRGRLEQFVKNAGRK
jgi:hypothetical protein